VRWVLKISDGIFPLEMCNNGESVWFVIVVALVVFCSRRIGAQNGCRCKTLVIVDPLEDALL
jgi:hypothetical protein